MSPGRRALAAVADCSPSERQRSCRSLRRTRRDRSRDRSCPGASASWPCACPRSRLISFIPTRSAARPGDDDPFAVAAQRSRARRAAARARQRPARSPWLGARALAHRRHRRERRPRWIGAKASNGQSSGPRRSARSGGTMACADPRAAADGGGGEQASWHGELAASGARSGRGRPGLWIGDWVCLGAGGGARPHGADLCQRGRLEASEDPDLQDRLVPRRGGP